MTIKNLNKLIKERKNLIKFINIRELRGKKIAIDVSIYMYKFVYSGNLLRSFLEQIYKFRRDGINILYVLYILIEFFF